MESLECLVVGGGIVGLAIARSLAMAGKEVIVCEQENVLGSHASSRNSEVIHSGLYYPNDSLKAWACVQGKRLLYMFADTHNVPFKKLGKMIIAETPAQHETLVNMRANALHNGVDDLYLLRQVEVQKLEPELNCYSALFSPSTGIIDSHAYLLALQQDISDYGGRVVLETPLLSADLTKYPFEVTVGGEVEATVKVKYLVNAGGLYASHTSQRMAGLPANKIPPIYYAKGNYFQYQGTSPFKHLIYPVPDKASLGIHGTLDLEGGLRFGPDLEWVNEINYEVDEALTEKFYQAIRRFYPKIKRDQLSPAYSGIRPKLSNSPEYKQDFLIQNRLIHGIDHFVALYGIESPGLTASLAIAEKVCDTITLP